MNFLLDVNVGTTVARALAGAGHDVVRVALVDAKLRDGDILGWAVREKLVLVSCDADFGELIYLHGAPAPPRSSTSNTSRTRWRKSPSASWPSSTRGCAKPIWP